MPRPDVVVREKLVSYATPTPVTSTFYGALVGTCDKGPVDRAMFLSSWSDYQSFYGGLAANSELSMAVYQYFVNGGTSCYVSRVLQTGALAATTAPIVATGGASNISVTVSAMSPGTWGNSLAVKFTLVNLAEETYNIDVLEGGTSGTVVETWLERSFLANSTRYFDSINSPISGSRYIRIALNTGVNGTLPSAAVALGPSGAVGTTTTSAEWLLAVDRLASLPTLLVLGTPGATGLGAGTYETFVNDVIKRVDPAVALTGGAKFDANCFYVADTIRGVAAATLASTFATTITDSSYIAVYTPWLGIIDPMSSVPGNVRTVSPVGSVIGKYIDTDAKQSVGKVPAGVGTGIAGCVGLDTRYSNAELDSLNDAGVNAIRAIPGGSFSIMGGRTMNPGIPDRYISIRRSLMYITSVLKEKTSFAMFEGNTPTLRNQLSLICTQFLVNEQSGGVLSNIPSPGAFYVTCDESNNTPQTISAGEIRIEVGVALTAPAEYIIINLIHYEGGSVVTTVSG